MGEDKNASNNFGPHRDEKLILEEPDIEEDHRNLGGKSLGIGSHIKDGLSEYILQTKLFKNELSSSLRKVRFRNQKFATNIPISNIKYNHLGF